MDAKNLLFCGVGGQGILMASEVTGLAAFYSGLDVKKSEIHGLSQRGGSVISHIRFGEKIYSPTVSPAESDFLVCFEKMEALRYVSYLHKKSIVLLNNQEILPTTVTGGQKEYPQNIKETLENYCQVCVVEGLHTALELKSIKVMNSILLGYFSTFLQFEENSWLKAFETKLKPAYVDMNKKAFLKGKSLRIIRN